MQTSLRTQVTQFTQEFDRELTRAYFWLQADRGPSPVATAFDSVGHFQRWFTTAPHPGLVRADLRGVAPAGRRQSARSRCCRRYDREREALVSIAALPAELAPIVRSPAHAARAEPSNAAPSASCSPVASEGPALVIPRPPVPVVNAGGAIVFSRDERPWDYTIVAARHDVHPRDVPARVAQAALRRGARGRLSRVDRRPRQQGAGVLLGRPRRHAAPSLRPTPPKTSSTSGCASSTASSSSTIDAASRRARARRQAPRGSRRPGDAPSPAAQRDGCCARAARNVVVTMQRERGPEGDPRRPDRQPLWRADFAHQAGSLEARGRVDAPAQPVRELERAAAARREHRHAGDLECAGPHAGRAADGVRRRRLA